MDKASLLSDNDLSERNVNGGSRPPGPLSFFLKSFW